MGTEGYERMKRFYEESEIGHQIAAPLVEGATAIVEFDGDPETYTLVKVKGRSVLKPGRPQKADIYFRFSAGAINYLFEPPTADAADYVNRLCDCLLETDPGKKVEFKLLQSLVTGWRKGYIAMMKLGGPRAISTVAKVGIRIPAKFLKDDRRNGAEQGAENTGFAKMEVFF
ncbi:MAG: hypothetical protein AB1742_15595 [bacterium]